MWGWKEISNEDLTLDDIPGPKFDDWRNFDSFALTFDGYDYWHGKGRDPGTIANRAWATYRETGDLPQSLTELRTCLFFEQRRLHHWGTGPEKDHAKYLIALLEAIRSAVTARESSV